MFLINAIQIAAPIIIVTLVLLSFYGTIKHIKKGGGCCGEKESKIKVFKVHDKNKANYQYKVELKIEGMTCKNCALKVENALNEKEGTYAIVNHASKSAIVYTKYEPNVEEFRQIIKNVGYYVISMNNLQECK